MNRLAAPGCETAVTSPLRKTCLSLFLAAILFTQGCASPYGKVLRQYQEARACCASIAELPVVPLQAGDNKSIQLGEGSPVYRFDTGKSYCQAFSLPDQSQPYKVSVSSYLIGAYLKSAYLFYPRLITLDKNYSVVRSTGDESFSLVQADFLERLNTGGDFQYKIEGDLIFTGLHPEERYLVIMTTDSLLHGKTAVPVGTVPMLILGGPVRASAKQEEVQVPHAPGGRVTVRVVSQDNRENTVPKTTGVAARNEAVSGPGTQPDTAEKREHAATSEAAASVRPAAVRVRLAGGKVIGELVPGKSSVQEAQSLFERFAAGMGKEKLNTTLFTIGSVSMVPKRLFSPPGTVHQLYFDDNGVLVILVDGSVAELPASGREFRLRFPDARETWRSIGSYELQHDLGPCVSLIAVFRTISDSPDSMAYGYRCPTQ